MSPNSPVSPGVLPSVQSTSSSYDNSANVLNSEDVVQLNQSTPGYIKAGKTPVTENPIHSQNRSNAGSAANTDLLSAINCTIARVSAPYHACASDIQCQHLSCTEKENYFLKTI
jgi:hypothetical protein